ncbi:MULTISPECIES: MarR family transcriptional regulator [Paenibacillus]|uniref:MarR family transcriptional regulator n=1 Tax=Paenibacillus TaxID=44249 RepID=UPI0022B8A3CD|nr:MarR family transcriptional regulator [Paenibacillus caseinilyticus]MCZ8520287.1 MarR family transcriptional regulator [Paenibacillus caseinilyticus]
MPKKEQSKQRVYQLFLQLLTQQEMREGTFSVRFEEEKRKMETELGFQLDLNLSEIHLIACIGDCGSVNVTALSEKTGLTKGSVTRISKKLLKLELILRQQLPDNKKEVYFRLTDRGARLHEIHRRLHRKMEEKFLRFLDKYTPEQLAFSRELLQDLLEWDY